MRFGFHPYASAVGFNQPSAHQKAQTSPLRSAVLCLTNLMERFEQLRLVLEGDANPLVVDPDGQLFILPSGGDPYHASLW